jgi:hypothetical protein
MFRPALGHCPPGLAGTARATLSYGDYPFGNSGSLQYFQARCLYLRRVHASGASRCLLPQVAESVFKYYHDDNKNWHRRNPL